MITIVFKRIYIKKNIKEIFLVTIIHTPYPLKSYLETVETEHIAKERLSLTVKNSNEREDKAH